MANTREIKNRIESVQQTRKITNAMYLIASTKLRKARNDLANTRPYFDALRGEIKRVFRTAGDVDSPYFYPPDNNTPLEGTYGCLVITADKGLAGAYNQNVIKEAEKLLAQHPDTKLYVVGEYGRRYFDQHKIPIEHSFLYTAQNPTLDRAREISALLLDGFLAGTLKEIFVVYTDMESSLEQMTGKTVEVQLILADQHANAALSTISVDDALTQAIHGIPVEEDDESDFDDGEE